MSKEKNKPAEAASNKPEAAKVAVKAEAVENPTVKRQRIANEIRAKRAKEVEAAKKEAEKKAAQKQSASEKQGKKPVKDTRKLFTDDRGLKYAFKHSAPKTLNIDGKSTPVEEIIENEEVMLELVYGNSNFIEQIH
jgi:hypothetical protein